MRDIVPRDALRCTFVFAQVPTDSIPFGPDHSRAETITTTQGGEMQQEEISEAIVACCARFIGDMEGNVVEFLKRKMSVCFCQAAEALGHLDVGNVEAARQSLGMMFVIHGMPIPSRELLTRGGKRD
jgi:hypothetical protein